MTDYKVQKQNEFFEVACNRIESWYYYKARSEVETMLATGRCKLWYKLLNMDWDKRVITVEVKSQKTLETKIFKLEVSLDGDCEITSIFAEQQ